MSNSLILPAKPMASALLLLTSCLSPAQSKEGVLQLLGKSLQECERVLGKTVQDPNQSVASGPGADAPSVPDESYRLATVSGFRRVEINLGEAYATVTGSELLKARPIQFKFFSKDNKATWQSLLKALKLSPAGVKAKKIDIKSMELSGLKGVPKGWHVEYIYNVGYKGSTYLMFWGK